MGMWSFKRPYRLSKYNFTAKEFEMKNSVVSFLAVVVLAVFLMSCVSVRDREMTPQERAQANVVGSVSTSFTSFQPIHISGRRSLTRRAHIELTRVARLQYGHNVEIRNITIQGRGSGWQAFYALGVPAAVGVLTSLIMYGNIGEGWYWGGIPALVIGNLAGNFQRITATADVVMHGTRPDVRIAERGLLEAVGAAAATLVGSIPQNATVAILNVHSHNSAAAGFILDEVEFRLVSSGRFNIVDRQRLAQIRIEQNFHLSGEVSDASAASIGNLLGASIVITGDIGTDVLGNRLTLRALDVNTGQIVTMALERF